jgi:hypothetical protein
VDPIEGHVVGFMSSADLGASLFLLTRIDIKITSSIAFFP